MQRWIRRLRRCVAAAESESEWEPIEDLLRCFEYIEPRLTHALDLEISKSHRHHGRGSSSSSSLADSELVEGPSF